MTGRHVVAASVLVGTTALCALAFVAPREPLVAEDAGLLVAAVGFCVVGTIVIARTDAMRIGFTLSLIGMSLLLAGVLSTGEGNASGSVSETSAFWQAIASASWWLSFGGIGLLMAMFPTGSAPGRRWRWVIPLGIGATGLVVAGSLFAERICLAAGESGCASWARNPIGLPGVPDPEFELPFVLLLLLVFILVAAVSMGVRFRRATGIERLQLKWISLAVGGFAAFLATSTLVEAVGLPLPAESVGAVVLGVVMLGLPATIGIALTRYRLYDIDRVVSRTVTYALVAGVVGVVYAIPVLVVPRLLGGSGDLVIAGATLAAAAVFNPARHRVQRAVDRRFDRARFDTQREVDALSLRLRSGATLETVTVEVGRIVRNTLGPDSAAIWIRTRNDVGTSGG